MTMPSKKEQEEILQWEDEQKKRGMTTTDRIDKAVTERLRREVEPWLRAHEQKIVEHDATLSELGESILAGFGRVSAAAKKFSLKR